MARFFHSLLLLFVFLFVLSATGSARAAVVSLVGDRDCFGHGGSCPDGPTAPTLPIHEAGDPAFMDISTQAQNPTYHHVYDLGGAVATGAALEIRTSELADNRGPWSVFFNDTEVGNFGVQTGDFIITYVFAIAADLLTGDDEVRLAINVPNVIDGYAIDYSELRIETALASAPVSQVPVPAALPLFLSALSLLGLGLWRRKRG